MMKNENDENKKKSTESVTLLYGTKGQIQSKFSLNGVVLNEKRVF